MWTERSDGANRLVALIRYPEGSDPDELTRRCMASPGFAADMAAGATHLLGWVIVAATIIPVADAAIVLGYGGSRPTAFGVHGATAAVMLVTAALLLFA